MADTTKATEAKVEKMVQPVELKEGERVFIVVTVNEDVEKGNLLVDGKYPILTAADGSRYIQRTLVYPAPAGLIEDPFTKKPAVEMAAADLGKAIGEWDAVMRTVKAAGGKIVTSVPDAKDMTKTVMIPGTLPGFSGSKEDEKLIPSMAEIFEKGFKLELQGPLNAQMRKDQIKVTGGKKNGGKKAATLTSIS